MHQPVSSIDMQGCELCTDIEQSGRQRQTIQYMVDRGWIRGPEAGPNRDATAVRCLSLHFLPLGSRDNAAALTETQAMPQPAQ